MKFHFLSIPVGMKCLLSIKPPSNMGLFNPPLGLKEKYWLDLQGIRNDLDTCSINFISTRSRHK